jgi:hypothetical protein
MVAARCEGSGPRACGRGRRRSSLRTGTRRWPKSENVRIPAAQRVAWYGTYTVDEAGKKYVAKIERPSFPAFEGAVREQAITFGGGTMTTTGSKVSTPDEEIL